MSSHPKSSSILSLFTTISRSKRDLFDNAVLKEGWLFKKSCIATQYKKRWIVLQGTKLFCYPSENLEHYINTTTSHKTQTFNLSLYRFKVEKDSKSPFKFFLINLSVTNGSNQVTFKTLTKEDCDEWIFKLQEAIISCNLSKYRGLAPLYSTFESAIAGADSDDSDTDSDKKSDENVYPDSKFDGFRIRSITISAPLSNSNVDTYVQSSDNKQYIENEANNTVGIKIMTPKSDDTAKNKKKRQQIEQEIIESEETYYYGISTLLNELLIPMFENKIIDENLYFKKITSSIPNLVAFHQLFLEQLTEAYTNSYDSNNTPIPNNNTPIAEDDKYQSIAQVFNAQNKEEFISIYITFISQYKTILDLFGITFHDNIKLQSFLREKRENMKPLSNYLILPVQRVPRYLLLLARLKKNSSKWSADFNDIECALQLVEEICAEINERKRKIENLSQCLQIQQCLSNLKETIVDQKRRFFKQFVFIKKENKRQRIFFVFNDMIIIGNKNWSVKEMINNMRIVDIKHDENDENDKDFTLFYGTNQCVYSAISIMEINELKHIITQNRLQLMDLDILEIRNKKNVEGIREKIKKQRDSNSNDFKIQQTKHLQLIYLIKCAYCDYTDVKGKIPSNVQLFLRFCKNKKNIRQANYSICEQIIKEMQTNE